MKNKCKVNVDRSLQIRTCDPWTSSLRQMFQESIDIDYTYKGKKDSDGRFHIYGSLTFDNGDVVSSEFRHGVRHGDAVIISERNNISRLCGTYVHGKLQGKGTMVNFYCQFLSQRRIINNNNQIKIV